jgi:hypothetical protein
MSNLPELKRIDNYIKFNHTQILPQLQQSKRIIKTFGR